MISCQVCGWKEDATAAAFADCPCCGAPLKASAAAPALIAARVERAEPRGWSVGAAPGRLPESAAAGVAFAAAAGRIAARHWLRAHAAAAAVAVVALGGVAIAGAAALRRLDPEPGTTAMTIDTSGVTRIDAEGPAVPEASLPPADVVRRELVRYLPAGYLVEGVPTLVRSEGGANEYRVTLRAAATLYRVPVGDLRLPPDAPSLLRQLADHLRVDPRLPPGKEYVLETPETVVAAGGTVEAAWRAAWTRTAEGWRLTSADPVRPNLGAGSDGGGVLLSAEEVDAARERRDAALAGYAERCRAAEREADAFRTEVMAGVPPACTAETATLLREVVRLTAECPQVADPDDRGGCYTRRDVLNRKLGACQTQDEEHERALAAAGRRADEFRSRRVASLASGLER